MLKLLGLDQFTDHLNTYARRLIVGNMINAIGMGLTMTLFLVYMHTVRHFSASFAGLMLSLMAIVAMAINPLVGILIDKYGGRIVLLYGLLIKAIGTFALSFITDKTSAILIVFVMSIGDACNWPAAKIPSELNVR